jgi:hypothetical protein
MMAVNLPSGAWWKQLSTHLHERTHNRLRGLQIRAVNGRVSIQAKAPCDRVRTQAEVAAREIVPDRLLAMRIKVDDSPGSVANRTGERFEANAEAESESPDTPQTGVRSRLMASEAMHRGMKRLINGN